MNFQQGVSHMRELCGQLQKGERGFFNVDALRIDYPGYKVIGDYRLSRNDSAPKHTDIVRVFYDMTDENNYDVIVEALNDIYVNGLLSKNTFFPIATKELLFWITLQEEINYPQPRYAGRKLPFQRFYEGILAKLGHIELAEVFRRTNNHGRTRPVLVNVQTINFPIFYI